jgi:hypothetical protein
MTILNPGNHGSIGNHVNIYNFCTQGKNVNHKITCNISNPDNPSNHNVGSSGNKFNHGNGSNEASHKGTQVFM